MTSITLRQLDLFSAHTHAVGILMEVLSGILDPSGQANSIGVF